MKLTRLRGVFQSRLGSRQVAQTAWTGFKRAANRLLDFKNQSRFAAAIPVIAVLSLANTPPTMIEKGAMISSPVVP